MSNRFVFVTLVSAALLGACSSQTPSDIRPEVAEPLGEARVLANGWSGKATIVAKLDQAASVPNLTNRERHQIRATKEYALARVGHGPAPPLVQRIIDQPPTSFPNYSQSLGPRDGATY